MADDRGKLLAKILISGDDHLSSKNHGQHVDYAKESFYYFKMLGDYCKDNQITHWIGLGDLTYGRFTSLEYRDMVEEEFKRQNEILNGNRWILKGNHDSASYGMTEYEYFLKKGYFKGSQLLQIGSLNINMVDYGKYNTTPVLVEDNKQNILLTHGYFAFKGGKYDFGEPVLLDNMTQWFGIPFMICGHIHSRTLLKGFINKDGQATTTQVHYLPCLSRPSYLMSGNPEKGQVVIITVYENRMLYDEIHLDLLPLEESFNLERIKEMQLKKEALEHNHVNLSDIVNKLATYDYSYANPEDIIMSQTQFSLEVRQKACELLKQADL